jgi:hypothetical protein
MIELSTIDMRGWVAELSQFNRASFVRTPSRQPDLKSESKPCPD